MKLDDVLKELTPVVGLTSLIGAPQSVSSRQALQPTLRQARREYERVQAAQAASNSDAAYWGWEGQRAYWACLVSLLEATEITGEDNLPDVPLPKRIGVVMDLS